MGNKKDSLGDRMKENYENRSKTYLCRRTPVIIRLDGCHFHTFLKGFEKPFDGIMVETMRDVTLELCKIIQGCVFGYTQSDEITLVLNDYKTIDSEAWFDYNVQKICSVSASLATLSFNKNLDNRVELFIGDNEDLDNEYVKTRIEKYKRAISNGATFDSRCFNIPKEEVINCILWRIKDCIKNSVSSLARSLFSHKELEGKNTEEKKEMVLSKFGIDWDKNLRGCNKYGTCVVKEESGWLVTDGAPTTYEGLKELIGNNLDGD